MKTRAAVYREPNAPLDIVELDICNLAPQDVLVRIIHSGICHSDLNVYHGTREWETPMILGHEGAGVVEHVGDGVTGVKPGDRVVLSLVASCGRCRSCAAGFANRCQVLPAFPIGTYYDGGHRFEKDGEIHHSFCTVGSFAEHAVVHFSKAVRVPDDVGLDVACLVGCGVPTGVGSAVNTAQVRRGSTCVVYGCGGVGLNVIQGCRLMGAAEIVAVDLLADKLALAEKFGATHTLNASDDDPVAAVMEMTGGRGADYAFEVIGSGATYMNAWNSIGMGGLAVMVGGPPAGTPFHIDATEIYFGKALTGSMYGNSSPARDFPWIFDLYRSGELLLDELITQHRPLDDVTAALDELDTGGVVRTVLDIGEE